MPMLMTALISKPYNILPVLLAKNFHFLKQFSGYKENIVRGLYDAM
jgi:hypothetical protein